MGPAAAFKFVGLDYFSFTLFGLSQILMDLEVLFRMMSGQATLHGFSNTYLGATVIGAAAVLVGKPLCEFCFKLWNVAFPTRWLQVPMKISWPVATGSAFIGTYSHVLLDSIMHADARPWAPFSDANTMHHVISDLNLHRLCLFLGISGVAGLFGVWFWRIHRSN